MADSKPLTYAAAAKRLDEKIKETARARGIAYNAAARLVAEQFPHLFQEAEQMRRDTLKARWQINKLRRQVLHEAILKRSQEQGESYTEAFDAVVSKLRSRI